MMAMEQHTELRRGEGLHKVNMTNTVDFILQHFQLDFEVSSVHTMLNHPQLNV